MNSSGDLDLVFQSGQLEEVFEKLRTFLKDYFIKRTIASSKSIIDKWKQDDIYPFSEDTEEKVDIAERQMFDILALNINSLMKSFAESPNEIKSFQFRMLRQTIEKSPKDLIKIIDEVIKLPRQKQIELAELLENNDLSSIISMSKLVSDRLKFIYGLEEIIFCKDKRKHFKERSQLHKILADNTWFFGEEFNLTVNDQSLTQVLRAHRKLIGNNTLIDDDAVKRLDGSTGIVDLMLSRDIGKNYINEREHLIVELKAPKLIIREKEISQIKSYADAVCKDPKFRGSNTKWTFILISTDVDDHVESERNQEGRKYGIIRENKIQNLGHMTIWVKTWSDIFSECKHRMKYIKESLEYNIDVADGIKYLKNKYSAYLDGVVE